MRSKWQSLKPDIVLLDIEMPDINGIEVINQLVESSIPVKVFVLSSYDDREYISNASMELGYLIKTSTCHREAVRGGPCEKGW
jgi:YesN/AraC family two-component response regulator